MTPEVARVVAEAGPWAAVIFLGGMVIWALWREHQRAIRSLEIDRDYWRSLALTGVEVADKSTDIAAGKAPPRRRG